MKLKICKVEWTDFSGCIGGEHLYPTIRYNHKKIELQRKMSAKDARYLNSKDDYGSYKAGDETQRFDSEEQIAKEARKQWKKLCPKGELLLMGNGAIPKALEGKKSLVDKINKMHDELESLYESIPYCAIEKCLDQDRVEELMDEYWELTR